MCYNAPVSAVTFIIGMSGSFVLSRIGLLAEAIFFAWVTGMQFFEFLLHMNDACNSTNVTTTHLGILLNHTQPVALWIGILLARRRNMPSFVHCFMCFYSIVAAVYTATVMNDECTVVTETSGGHLYWAWNTAPYSIHFYVLFLGALALLAAYGLEFAMFYTVMNFASYAASYVIYGATKTVGAQWCFLAAFSPWVTLAFVDVRNRGHRDVLRRLTTSTSWERAAEPFKCKV
jgi:hypothetical protein